MGSPNRRHERQSFFKYMSADSARKVLTNCSLRWSSPVLFNDPFDVPRELSFGITPKELVRACGVRMEQLIENPPENTTIFQPKLRLILDTIKKGVSPELKAELLSGVRDVTVEHSPNGESMEALRALWRAWLPDQRILCLTESAAHAAMWYHYADEYRGVVLEFLCLDELDSAWLAARPVMYPPSKPAIYTVNGWAELLCMQQDAATKAIFEAATYTKSPDWSYEAEWRIGSFKRPGETGNFSDYKFSRQELGAVYFGPMISAEDRVSLCIAAGAYPTARLYDVSIGMSRDFTFREADV